MESHVTVLQTGLGLLESGFAVFLVADATSSRTSANRQAAIERLRAAGGKIVTTENGSFEWLEKAGTAGVQGTVATHQIVKLSF